MNSNAFLAGQAKYSAESYAQFAQFGGPSVYSTSNALDDAIVRYAQSVSPCSS